MLSSPPEVFKSLLGAGKTSAREALSAVATSKLKKAQVSIARTCQKQACSSIAGLAGASGLKQQQDILSRFAPFLFSPFIGSEFLILTEIKWELKYVHGVIRQCILICGISSFIFLSEGLLQGHCIAITTMLSIFPWCIMWFPHKGWCHRLNIPGLRDKVSGWRSPTSSWVNIRASCGRVKCTRQAVGSTIARFNCRVTVSCRAKVSATLQRSETRAWPCDRMWLGWKEERRALHTHPWRYCNSFIRISL